MLRICLCLLLVAASASVAAREVKLSAPGGETCDEQSHHSKKADHREARSPAPPRRETEIKPRAHGDADGGGRVPSPRWHSFLPGMFR